jgi:Domain of unknown function (DUF4293)
MDSTMIQRIQTVYFFLAALFSASGFFLPVYRIASPATTPTEYTLMDYEALGLPLVLGFSLAVILSLTAIGLYKNRPLQIRMGRFTILLLALLLAWCALSIATVPDTSAAETALGIGVFTPVGGIVFTILAIRGDMYRFN